MEFSETTLLYLLTGLAAVGIILSVYLTGVFLRVQRGLAVKCFDGSCPIVMKTPYARSLGIPNFYPAIPFYGGLLVFAVLRLAGFAAWLFVPVAVAAALALAMSAYLALMLLVKLKQP
ncbi:MAG: hypothetical protein HY000_09130 [Planctomycetes bacterium]|nr:hypothetical protein [Planctomycetota bacterium]